MRDHAGSALIEALVALVLIAVAGAMVASAAANGLRAASRAATIGRTTELAARELAVAANQAATATDQVATLAVSGFPAPATCATDVERDGAVVELTVRVEAGRPAEHVTLATHRLLDQDD